MIKTPFFLSNIFPGETPSKEDLSLITSLCKDDLAQRVLVTNSGGYGTLVSLVKEQTVTDVR